ncbi:MULTISPECIES: S53 family peptidase [Sphingomonas]|uniref:S53 family peptidase n=1 Tax=Sphingomonas TaxID=13687 RepID=UPI001966B8DA|nr:MULTISPECIES: S53 family peptidase [Sphingomonas]
MSSVASAAPIERSGNGFHRAVCEHVATPGQAYCHSHVRVDARGEVIETKDQAAQPFVTPGGYSPADLKSAYKITGTGSGRTIAIVDAYGYSNAEADLAVYRAQYGLAPCTTANGCFKKVNQSGSTTSSPRDNTGWDQEAALDLDMASALCNSCKIILVQANSASLADLAAAVNTAANLGANVISNSYGGGENGATTYAAAYNHPGIAITVSSGDSGYGVQFPASAPTVTAVGGTALTKASNARGWNETAWSGAGSGCSAVFAKPSWQNDPLCATRMEADVSAVADPNTGVAVYGPTGRGTKSGWMVFGGTSVAAPVVGAIYAVAGDSVNGAQELYSKSSSLNDVTSGSNGSCGGTYQCTAGVGYDGPTGLGTPNTTAAF